MIEMEPNPLNIDVRTQRDGIGTAGESNVQITQPSGNVIPSIGLGESTPILNANTESENNSDTLRGSPCNNSRTRFARNSGYITSG